MKQRSILLVYLVSKLIVYLKTNLLTNYNFIFNLLDGLTLHRATIYIYIVNHKFSFIKVCNETAILIIVTYYAYIGTILDANFITTY
jgi:hypothetical protein